MSGIRLGLLCNDPVTTEIYILSRRDVRQMWSRSGLGRSGSGLEGLGRGVVGVGQGVTWVGSLDSGAGSLVDAGQGKGR